MKCYYPTAITLALSMTLPIFPMALGPEFSPRVTNDSSPREGTVSTDGGISIQMSCSGGESMYVGNTASSGSISIVMISGASNNSRNTSSSPASALNSATSPRSLSAMMGALRGSPNPVSSASYSNQASQKIGKITSKKGNVSLIQNDLRIKDGQVFLSGQLIGPLADYAAPGEGVRAEQKDGIYCINGHTVTPPVNNNSK